MTDSLMNPSVGMEIRTEHGTARITAIYDNTKRSKWVYVSYHSRKNTNSGAKLPHRLQMFEGINRVDWYLPRASIITYAERDDIIEAAEREALNNQNAVELFDCKFGTNEPCENLEQRVAYIALQLHEINDEKVIEIFEKLIEKLTKD